MAKPSGGVGTPLQERKKAPPSLKAKGKMGGKLTKKSGGSKPPAIKVSPRRSGK